MKFSILLVTALVATFACLGRALVVPQQQQRYVIKLASSKQQYASSREDFLQSVSLGFGIFLPIAIGAEPAIARGRATLEKSYERYAPRIRAGTEFYKDQLRSLVEKNDWKGIKLALQEPPERQKGDLNKSDAGVAARARQAGGFSDARVLVAADLFAAAFSDNKISPKTKKMQDAVAKLREVVGEMEKTAKLALGEEKIGGFLGFGATKPTETELAKTMRQLYVTGGNALNEYLYDANDELALKFTRFEYVK